MPALAGAVRRILVVSVLSVLALAPASAEQYHSDLPEGVSRPWIGPELWGVDKRLKPDDWALENGRIQCLKAGDGRAVHCLTRELTEADGTLEMSVRMGRKRRDIEGFSGFLFAVTGVENEYRANMYVNQGLRAGLTGDGKLRIGDMTSGGVLSEEQMEDAVLEMTADCTDNNAEVTLRVSTPDGDELGELSATVTKDPLAGNLALACEGDARSWFSDWTIDGTKVAEHPDRTFGPILWTQYTLHNRTLKMAAFMGALSDQDSDTVTLEIKKDGEWHAVDTARIDRLDTPYQWRKIVPVALFRVECWDDTKDTPFRVGYNLKTSNNPGMRYWQGTIRRDPVDKETIKLSVVTGMGRVAWPNHHMQQNIMTMDPDICFFSGDNVYGEQYAVFGWSFRELLRDRPSICTPDDHDVGANDLWGRGGELRPEDATRAFGGYRADPVFVNWVHKLQTCYLPDPEDSSPSKNGISVYYTDVNYGRVSFAVIDDRHFKSAPGQALDKPIGHDRMGNMEKVKADPETFDPDVLDKPGLELLGPGQERFLENWAADWRDTDLKMVLHQSPFCQSANYGGGAWPPDLDTNGWPQSGRDRALRAIRKGFAPTASGDTHLGMLMQQGVEEWGDAAWQYVCPAGGPVSNRNWNPGYPGKNHVEGMPGYTGDYTGALGNKFTVWAVSNPGTLFARSYREPDGSQVDLLQKRVAGYGIIEYHKGSLDYTFNNYPIYGRLESPDAAEQYPGWPRTVPMESNYGATPKAWLPTLKLQGEGRPSIQVLKDSTGEVVYARRLEGKTFRPHVFDPDATYSVVVGEVGSTNVSIVHHLKPAAEDDETEVTIEY